MEIALSPSVAEAISRGAVVEQLRGRDAFRDDDDASSVCTLAPDDGPRLDAEAAAAAWQAVAAAADRVAAAATADAAAQRLRADALARQVEEAVSEPPAPAPAPAPPHAEAPAPPRPLASPVKPPFAREAPAPARPPTPAPLVARRVAAATQTPADDRARLKRAIAGLERDLDARAAEAQRREQLLVRAKGEIHALTYELLGMRARAADATEALEQARTAAAAAEAYARRRMEERLPKPEPAPQPVPVPIRRRPSSASAAIYNRDTTWAYLKKGRGTSVVDGRRRTISRHHRASEARETPYGNYHVDTDSVPPKLHGLGFRRKPATRQAPMEYVRGPRSPARPRPRPASAPSRRRPLPYEDPDSDDSLRVDPEHTSPWVKSLSVKVRLSSPD